MRALFHPRHPAGFLAATLGMLLPLFAMGAPNTTAVAATGQKLDFGTFSVLPSCVNCTITMSTSGVRTASAGVVLSSTNHGKAATFNVTCNNGACTWTPAVSGSPTMSAGAVTMTVSTFTTLKAATNTPSLLTVGARLTIPGPGAATGTYTSGAVFTVTTTP